MGTKDNPDQFDCYAAAANDEPLFVLKSTDDSAPTTVRIWAELYRERKMKARRWTPAAIQRYCQALQVANQMAEYRHRMLGAKDEPAPFVPTDVGALMGMGRVAGAASLLDPDPENTVHLAPGESIPRRYYGAGSGAAQLLNEMAVRGARSGHPEPSYAHCEGCGFDNDAGTETCVMCSEPITPSSNNTTV